MDGSDANVRIVVRDQLLDALIGHIRRRGDDYLAQMAERIVGVVRANDDRIVDAAVAHDVAMFADFDLSRGKQKPANSELRAAAVSALTTTSYLRSELGERGADWSTLKLSAWKRSTPSAGASTAAKWKEEEWKEEVLQSTWRECLRGDQPLGADHLAFVRRARTIDDAALRLIYFATREKRQHDEIFENFRKQVKRQMLRAHPWTEDSKSAT